MTRLVVIGLGYVGLPLAVNGALSGYRVHGFDTNLERIEALSHGASYVDDVSAEQLNAAAAAGFTPTDDPTCLASAGVIVICVPTPLKQAMPDLSAVVAASDLIAAHHKPGVLVILESTTYPGTTEEVVRPILERNGRMAGRDFYLAFSPERIDPGNHMFDLRNTPKIVGGVTAACARRATDFYKRFVDRVVVVSRPEIAEMTKLLENTYRQVNIALVNEMAIFCDEMGIDLWEVIDAASTKPFGFHGFRPGPGVGGHCIPIDPNYLSYRVRGLGYPFRFVELAQEINQRMPAFVVTRIGRLLNDRCRSVKNAKVLLLGVTYKPDIADDRESPARIIAERLLALGADVRYHDPYTPEWQVAGVRLKSVVLAPDQVGGADVVVLLQDHKCYDLEMIAEYASLLFDTRGRAHGSKVVRL